MYYYKSQGTVFVQDSEITNSEFEKISEEEYKNIVAELQTDIEKIDIEERNVDNG